MFRELCGSAGSPIPTEHVLTLRPSRERAPKASYGYPALQIAPCWFMLPETVLYRAAYDCKPVASAAEICCRSGR